MTRRKAIKKQKRWSKQGEKKNYRTKEKLSQMLRKNTHFKTQNH